MIGLADAKKGEKMVDLGSGDGRIVVEFGKIGVEAHGYEIDWKLLEKSEENIKKAKLIDKAFIHEANFWKEDLSEYDIITIYGMPSVLPMLEQKLERELKMDTRVISSIYEFPNWKYKNKKDNVFLYTKES